VAARKEISGKKVQDAGVGEGREAAVRAKRGMCRRASVKGREGDVEGR